LGRGWFVISGTSSNSFHTPLAAAAAAVCSEEGFLAFWKGNGVNIIRIFPYSAGRLQSVLL
jgi:solute carrier family 25 phosphate transporter 23/24/25/41